MTNKRDKQDVEKSNQTPFLSIFNKDSKATTTTNDDFISKIDTQTQTQLHIDRRKGNEMKCTIFISISFSTFSFLFLFLF